MKKNTLLFFGTIKKVANCGESMKNHLFIERYREVYDKVITVDLFHPRHHPFRVLWMLILAISHPKDRKVVSISIEAADVVLRLLEFCRCKHIYYWAVGGTLHKRIVELGLNPNTYRKIDAIYCQSDQIVDGLRQLGIYNAMKVDNSKRIDFVPDISNRNNDKIRFVFLSRVHKDKGCDLIVESAKWLNDNGYRDKFIVDFYGKCDPAYELQFLESISGFDNVKYKGFLSLVSKTGYETLSTYDIMLFPTWWDGEGFPGVIIDAYIAGLPVIASNWNCNAEVVDDSIGLIIPHHDQQALLDAMKKVIDGNVDIKTMSSCCQEKARNYDNRIVLSKEKLIEIGMLDEE